MQRETVEEVMEAFWANQLQKIMTEPQQFKKFALPLARIKKVMKSDDEIKQMMISCDTPILFSKACELFILELSLRSWLETEGAKRRTLQKADVVKAIQKSEMFDFLIDIIPKNEPIVPAYFPQQYNDIMAEEQLLQYNLSQFYNVQGNMIQQSLLQEPGPSRIQEEDDQDYQDDNISEYE